MEAEVHKLEEADEGPAVEVVMEELAEAVELETEHKGVVDVECLSQVFS